MTAIPSLLLVTPIYLAYLDQLEKVSPPLNFKIGKITRSTLLEPFVHDVGVGQAVFGVAERFGHGSDDFKAQLLP